MEDMDGHRALPSRLWRRLRMRLFHLYFLLSRPMTLGVRALVFDREAGSVLLVRHTYVDGWHLPGGGVEPGETMLTALARELAEEGNIEMIGPAELRSIHFNRRTSRRDHVALYLVEHFRQTAEPVPNAEIAEAWFFPLGDLPAATSPSSAQRIAELVERTEPSPEW